MAATPPSVPDASVGAFVVVGARASVGARTVIYPNTVIGADARIGDDCVIHAGVSIHDRVTIGHRVTILDGAVIGSDGFGFVRQPDGTHFKIPQLADVVIEDDVEIGANTTIDRPAVGETRIQAGTKIDNLVQIAHGVRIGRRGLVASQVGIAGSTVIEDDVTLAGQVGVNGHIRIGQGAIGQREDGRDAGRRARRVRVRLSVHAQLRNGVKRRSSSVTCPICASAWTNSSSASRNFRKSCPNTRSGRIVR